MTCKDVQVSLADFSEVPADGLSKCVVCGERLGQNHVCSEAGIKRYNRSEGAKNAARTRSETARYGHGLSYGQKLSAGMALRAEGGDCE